MKRVRRALIAIALFMGAHTPIAGGVAPLFAGDDVLRARPIEAAPGSDDERYFEEKIRPILAERCWSCHGVSKQESSLRLDSADGLKKGGASGQLPLAGDDAGRTLFLLSIRREGDFAMPPETPLAPPEIALLTEWVTRGAPWPKNFATPAPPSPTELVEQARRTHWSFQPITRPAVPDVEHREWTSTAMDRLILKKLEAAVIPVSGVADRRTQIRRLTFDLTGVPPSDDQVREFSADDRPDARDRLVDRLLASPQYGERWGRHWLDIARYADTKGYAFAQERRYPYAYTYRDYVISAWNADLPFNQFVVEQLAADLLPPSEDKRALAAMGFLTAGRKFNNRNDDLDDQIDVVGRGLLGLTVACARCHEHKFDPIPTEDYYSLYGIFGSSREPENLPELGPPADSTAFAKFQQQLKELQDQRERYRLDTHKAIVEQARSHVGDYLVRAISEQSEETLLKLPIVSLKKGELRTKIVERWKEFVRPRLQANDPVFGAWREFVSIPADAFASQAPQVLERLKQMPAGTAAGQLNPAILNALLRQPLTSREDVAHAYGQALSEAYQRSRETAEKKEAAAAATVELPAEQKQLLDLLAAPNSPTDIAEANAMDFFNRAEKERYRDLGKKIDSLQATSPGAPPRAMVLAEDKQPMNPHVLIRGNPGRPGKAVPRQFLLAVAGPDRQPFRQGSGRLELARAIVDEANPLTRRVFANRVWMYHFNEPLVSTPADFGLRCAPPVQQDVLNHLSFQLAVDGWSVKSLHREIVLSSVYQQTSNDRTDGTAADPENRLLWRMNRRRLEFEAFRDSLLAVSGRLDPALGGRPVDLTQPAERRRTVYALIDRQDLPGIFRVFDFPSPDQSNERRPRTTVPQQALFGMNSPIMLEYTRALAARPELRSTEDPGQRCVELYRLVFGRDPSAAELEIARQFVLSAATDEVKLTPWEQLAQILLLTNEFAFVD